MKITHAPGASSALLFSGSLIPNVAVSVSSSRLLDAPPVSVAACPHAKPRHISASFAASPRRGVPCTSFVVLLPRARRLLARRGPRAEVAGFLCTPVRQAFDPWRSLQAASHWRVGFFRNDPPPSTSSAFVVPSCVCLMNVQALL